MNSPNLVAQTIFCERVRPEAQGQTTLLGIYPDHVELRQIAEAGVDLAAHVPHLPSFSLYTRIRMPLEVPVRDDVRLQFMSPSSQIIFDGLVKKEFIEQSIEDARGQGNEYVVLLQQAEMFGFPIFEQGRFRAAVIYDGEEYFSGAIRFSVVTA